MSLYLDRDGQQLSTGPQDFVVTDVYVLSRLDWVICQGNALSFLSLLFPALFALLFIGSWSWLFGIFATFLL